MFEILSTGTVVNGVVGRLMARIRGRRWPHAALVAVVIFQLVGGAPPAVADERAFVYSYEASTMPKGAVEYEQWVTWKTRKDVDKDFDRIDFRHEIEFGITDKFQLAFYVADWRYEDSASVEDHVEYRDAAVEAILQLTDPTVDSLGVALYGEFKGGDELLEVETKLILQKNIGQTIFVWNGTFEAEWEGERYDEDKAVLEQTFGVSYQVVPQLTIGGELIHEVEYEDWDHWGDHVAYLGPNVSYRQKQWWMTIAPLFQVTDVSEEPNFQTRMIFGIDF